ncbi:hypothetical protein NKH80_28505 [Mesorhizobium sp. M0904]|uniref:hypothetical protein n=1 Tax=Mesorhizobium sp. M0904 TaxID=2957022 RepID=UPI00333A4A01
MKNDVDWKQPQRAVGSERPSFRGCERMFGELAHDFPSVLAAAGLRIALQVSCQTRKSFHNNDMALIAVCLMSDFVEDPTTNAAVTA